MASWWHACNLPRQRLGHVIAFAGIRQMICWPCQTGQHALLIRPGPQGIRAVYTVCGAHWLLYQASLDATATKCMVHSWCQKAGHHEAVQARQALQ